MGSVVLRGPLEDSLLKPGDAATEAVGRFAVRTHALEDPRTRQSACGQALLVGATLEFVEFLRVEPHGEHDRAVEVSSLTIVGGGYAFGSGVLAGDHLIDLAHGCAR